MLKLNKCVGRGNTLNDLSNELLVSNKTYDFILSVFNMITGINEWKTLTKQISCACKYTFDGIKCNINHWWNSDKCRRKCKKHNICQNYYIWNPPTCSSEHRKFLSSIMDNSTIICHKAIESYDEKIKANSANFVEKKSKLENGKFLYFTCVWLLTIGLLIAVIIYCYLIKYQAIQNFSLREVLC